jgi:DNA-binding transcriptional MerR regulator
MGKSAEAFRTISEVAEELGVAKHVLRFWEVRFTHIRPMKRGGGRRFYRPEDVELLRGINHLLHREGYTIKGVQRIFREQGVEVVKERGRGGRQAVDVERAKAQRKPAKRGTRDEAVVRRTAPARAGGGPGDLQRNVRAAIAQLEECRDLLVKPPSNGARARARAS